MFAAAAVAAAAALTAISTTQSSSSCQPGNNGATTSSQTGGHFNKHPSAATNHHLHHQYQRCNTAVEPSPSHSLSHFHSASSARSLDACSTGGQPQGATSPTRPYISWKQYAMQRRNSMQRRKIEISRRLEQASNANQKKTYNIQQFQANKQKSTDGSINSRRSFASEVGSGRFKRQNTAATTDSQDTSSNDLWLRQMSVKVCNEFLKLQQTGALEFEDPEAPDNIDLINNMDLGLHPTYKNFDAIAQLMQSGGTDPSSLDFDKISQALFEYLRALNLTQESFASPNGDPTVDSFDCASSFAGPMGPFGDDCELGSLATSAAARRCFNKEALVAQQLKRQKEEKLNYLLMHRWDPRWLRSMRTNCCIPFAILAFIFLVLTNLSSNWIRFDKENQRAGLWSICNTTRIEQNLTNIDQFMTINDSTSRLDDTTMTGATYSSTIKSQGLASNLLSKAGKMLIKTREDCFSKFFLQEDSHLAIICLILISLLFHLIGTALLIIGFISSLSQRTLYFYHSAGECLITSAIVHMIDLTAFAIVVQVQYSGHLSFRYGYCFYVNVLIAVLTLVSSIVLHLDDLVNEWKIWKVKAEYASAAASLNSKSKRAVSKPADLFLSSI